MIKNLEFDEAEIQAGAIACSSELLAVGTYGGYAKFGYPDLQLMESDHNVFAESCIGVQLSGTDIILLGHDVSQSLGKRPADWKSSLIYLSDKGVSQRFDLGPGNWWMVKGLQGRVAVLYDRTEGQGIVAVDAFKKTCLWRLKQDVDRICKLHGGDLLAMGNTILNINARSGTVIAEYELPPQDFVRWTAASRFDGDLLLGGYLISRREYLLAQWNPVKRELRRASTYPLESFFSPKQITRSINDEECCGADIFAIGVIRLSDDNTTVVLALGGDGEQLGAHQGASAVALVNMTDLSIVDSCVVDDEDGASGLLLAPDGAIVVNCCSSVYVVRL